MSLVAGATRISTGQRVAMQIVMLGVIAGLVAVSRRSRRRGTRALSEQEALNTRLRVLVLEADDETRRSVAELLHGPVQGRLLAAELGLVEIRDQAVLSVAARDRLGSVMEILRSLRDDDVRRLSHLLHPVALDVGMVAAFRSLIAQMTQTYSVSIALHVAPEIEAVDGPGRPGLPKAVRITLYRALEEAINNARRHGAATSLDVFVECDDGLVRIRVCDDGTGLDGANGHVAANSPAGLGLTAIAVRAGARGGRVTLGRAGDHTELTAEVRVRRADLGVADRGVADRGVADRGVADLGVTAVVPSAVASSEERRQVGA
jgi:signal transduction histidine kinase